MAVLGAGALLVFAVVPGLVVRLLFGPRFRDAAPYVFLVGVIGLALSLDNLLVQFFMAVHDRLFVPILAAARASLLAVSIACSTPASASVVTDVLGPLLALLAALTARLLCPAAALHAGDAGWTAACTKAKSRRPRGPRD